MNLRLENVANGIIMYSVIFYFVCWLNHQEIDINYSDEGS